MMPRPAMDRNVARSHLRGIVLSKGSIRVFMANGSVLVVLLLGNLFSFRRRPEPRSSYNDDAWERDQSLEFVHPGIRRERTKTGNGQNQSYT